MSSEILQIAATAESVRGQSRRGVIVDQRPDQRSDDDWVLHRALFLTPSDRAMVEGFYDKGMSAAQIARLMDIHPGTVRRRTRRLIHHLRSPMFGFILAHRGDWSRRRRTVAEMHLLQRRPLRDTARGAKLTMHIVRREVDAIRAQFEAFCFELESPARRA